MLLINNMLCHTHEIPDRPTKIDFVVIPISSLGFLDENKEFDEVQLTTVTIDQDMVSRMGTWVQPQAGTSRLRINRLKATAIKIMTRELELPGIEATVNLTKDGSLKNVLLRDARVNVELTPTAQGILAKVSAKNWQPPFGPPVEFSELTLTANIAHGTAAISGIEGRIYNGTLTGDATLKWGKELSAEGQLNLKGTELTQLMSRFTNAFSASGNLDLNARFSSQGQKAEELFAAPRINATFTLHKGVINNVDLVRAIQSPSRAPQRGGKTQFNEISGELQVAGNRSIYRNLKLASGPMTASSAFDVAPGSDLSGRVSVVLGTQSVVVARGTLTIGGDVKDPLLSQ